MNLKDLNEFKVIEKWLESHDENHPIYSTIELEFMCMQTWIDVAHNKPSCAGTLDNIAKHIADRGESAPSLMSMVTGNRPKYSEILQGTKTAISKGYQGYEEIDGLYFCGHNAEIISNIRSSYEYCQLKIAEHENNI